MEEQIKNDEMEIDLVALFHTLIKKAWVILLCLITGVVIAGGYTMLFITPQYQSASTIYVLGNAAQISNTSIALSLSKQLTVDFTILSKSRPVMERVIEKLNLDYSVEQLAKMITVENPTDSSILKVTVTNPDPQLSANIANEMADSIAERIAEVMLTDKPSTVEEAIPPMDPTSPSLKKNILLGGILGAGLAVGIFVVLFLMDDTIKTEEDVKKYLHMNTIATISKEKKKKRAV